MSASSYSTSSSAGYRSGYSTSAGARRARFNAQNLAVMPTRPLFKRPVGLSAVQRKQVKKLVQDPMEHKFFTANFSPVMGITSAPQSLSLIAQGDTDSTRDGDSLTLKSMYLSGVLEKNAADLRATQYIRIVLFQWHPNSLNIVPTAAQLFLTDPPSGTINYNSYYIKDNRDQFTILFDRTYLLTGLIAGGNSTTTSAVKFKANISLKRCKKHLQYNAGATTGTQQIYGMTLGVAAANPVLIQAATRINYLDA